MATYLVDLKKIKKNTFLDKNVDDKIIKIALGKAQEEMIEPVIGTDLYEKLLSGIREGDMSSDNMNLIINYLWKPIYYATCFFAYRHMVWKETNAGLTQSAPDNQNAIDTNELTAMRNEAKESYKFHINKFQLYMQQNGSTFPEYNTVDDGLSSTEQQMGDGFYYDGPLDI